MEFFCYHRDRRGSLALRGELLEAHWSYMDGYAKEIIARGPTLEAHGGAPTGSVHVVDLPSVAAARAFAFDEPGYQAGVYRDVMLRRWRNLLGRTMWEFSGGREGDRRFLVLGLGPTAGTELALPQVGREELIAFGPLLSDDGDTWLGTAVLVRAVDSDAARAILDTGDYAEVELHDWQFGGRA
ncbi:YciI family protein [Streptacidiphilus jiangxiensis]|uniref:YCII-related domain-containing protein n=1 Tax=Streptacidiphilus jiangxiensis TaxID=235985 RepID=A0A1H7L8C5_STRJI|nr:YciI family protein [Streptacidiphilus jiangxiensis]SEK95219.1 hypothetical protein SAMN05414137_104391 [Streptacidiphilus jiangxiensis]